MWLYIKRGRVLGRAVGVKKEKLKKQNERKHVELSKDKDMVIYRLNWEAKLEKGEQRNVRKE